jgi:hypothetical protein
MTKSTSLCFDPCATERWRKLSVVNTRPSSWILSSVPSSVCLELWRKEGQTFSFLNIPIKGTLACVLCYERKPIGGRAAGKVVHANTSCLWKNGPYLLTVRTLLLVTWTNRRIENYFGLNENKKRIWRFIVIKDACPWLTRTQRGVLGGRHERFFTLSLCLELYCL